MTDHKELVFEAEKILAEKQHTTTDTQFQSVLNDCLPPLVKTE